MTVLAAADVTGSLHLHIVDVAAASDDGIGIIEQALTGRHVAVDLKLSYAVTSIQSDSSNGSSS